MPDSRREEAAAAYPSRVGIRPDGANRIPAPVHKSGRAAEREKDARILELEDSLRAERVACAAYRRLYYMLLQQTQN